MIHSATTTKNPYKVMPIRDKLLETARYYPWYSQISQPWAWPVSSPTMFKVGINITETLPLNMIDLYANITQNPKLQK